MIDDLKNGLMLAKGVVDLAKGLKDLSGKTDNLEIREAAVELHSQTIDLKETVNEMRERILKLEDELEFNKKLDFNGQTFEYMEVENKRYICNGCVSKKEFVHMSEDKRDDGYFAVSCPVCKHRVTFTEGALPERKTRKTRRNSSTSWMS